MEKELNKSKSELDELCEAVYHGTQKFFKMTLRDLVSYKIFVAHKLETSPLFKIHGEGLVEMVSEKTGVSPKVLYDSIRMYEVEGLFTPKNQAKFIKDFPEAYGSWNEYRAKRLVGGSAEVSESRSVSKCAHCPLHCK